MAQIRKIVRENPLSSYQQAAPEGGGAFRVLAEGLNQIYDRLEPVAMDQMRQKGEELGREEARKQFGDARPYQQDTVPDVGAPSGDGIDDFNRSLARTESGGNYQVTNSEGYGGKYQFGQARLNDYNRAHGANVKVSDLTMGTPEARELTERVQRWHVGDIDADLGDLVGATVKGQTLDANAIRAMAHLGGKGGARKYVESGGKYDPADSNGTRLSHYAKTHGGGGEVSGVPTVSTRSSEPAVMVRTSSGNLEARLYSPYSGPILQAHNAAAQVAYQAEVYNKAAIDMMDMSNQFLTDPDGFHQAAQQYVDTIVDTAPQDFKSEIRGTLEKEMTRRRFGIMEDKQKDIRARANNASSALVDRWSDAYAEALISGDPAAIEEARSSLDGILQAREALPGVAWTDEQSANVFLKARKYAETQAAKMRKEASNQSKDTLNLIIKSAKNGRRAVGEEAAFDAGVMLDHPELAREAQAFIDIRNNRPELLEMPPYEQAEVAGRMAATEVAEEWQLDATEAVAKIVKENAAAWDKDPVERAFEVLKTNPPPQLPEMTPDDPDKFVSGMADRRQYMNDLFEAGYTDTKAYLSDDEAKQIAAFMQSDTPPELRAAMAAAIVGGFGEDAIHLFNEIKADPVTTFAGKSMALGGDPNLAAEMLRGQQMMQEGLVRVPPEAKRIDQFNADVASAFDGVPGAIEAQGEVMAAAQALYAADPEARTIEPTSDAAKDVMARSIQKALGQSTNKRGELTGGVQEVAGHNTLLPVGMSGKEADRIFRRAMGAEVEGPARGPLSALNEFLIGHADNLLGIEGANEPNVDVWIAATATDDFDGSVPLFNGQPIPKSYVDGDNLRLIPAGPGGYRMEIISGSSSFDVEDVDGNILFFDLGKLMEAMR